MSEIRQVEFPTKDLPLRQDVSLLGRLLGDALVEQHGEQLLTTVEQVRTAAIAVREGTDNAAQILEQTLAELDTETVEQLIKAFSSYLRLANLAEKTHRIRRSREYLKQGAQAQRGSLEQVIGELAASGCKADELASVLQAMRLRPVFTAHPTEATRRSFLEKEYSIVLRLVERLNPDRTPQEEQQLLDRISDAINSAWQTSTVPQARPTVADELDNVLFYLTDILYRVAAPFHESLEQSLARHYPDLPAVATSELLRFGSWVGGDMDGNPNVTATTLLESLATQRAAIIRCYLPDISRLARYLSQSREVVGFDAELEQRLAHYSAQLPELLQTIPARHLEMPYRCLLHFVAARLRATSNGGPHAYSDAAELEADVALVATSLEAHKGRRAGLFGVQRLLHKIRIFGFHLATLDARQDAMVHREAIAQWLGRKDWLQETAGARTTALARQLASHEAVLPAVPGANLQACVDVFAAFRTARRHYGPQATGLFIISMTQGPDDVLSALALARLGGLGEAGAVPLDIAPLLETVDDLQAGPAIIEQLLQLGSYREHLARRGNRQVIMVGYSDSNKDSGIVSARWSLFEAQRKLIETGLAHGITIHFFHGRGGTVSRGGGNLINGIEGAPAGSINGYMRITEQGEVINQKYGIRPLALRNLELMAGAMLRHRFLHTASGDSPEALDIMDQMATNARQAYRGLVFENPQFVPFFRSATPIDVIEQLNIGSRPASRRSGAGIENLRAIPWVFSWGQARVGLPGVFGMGTALQLAVDEHGLASLRKMLADWSFFRGLVADVEMVLAKSTLQVGRRYACLAPDELQGVFTDIEREFALATHWILELKEQSALLEDQHTLRRNIRLRNPYADPMHLLQIDLLERWRAGGREDETLLKALKSTVNGIALAIQNTG
jgi:phosphoenolpyruvate carboxylase